MTISSISETLARWKQKHQERQRQNRHQREYSVLEALPDYLLADVGITRAMAQAEARRLSWDVPRHWRS